MATPSPRTIEIHYDLFDNNCHTMDALAYNKAEYNLILAICYLNRYINGEIKVKVEAKQEVRIIDILKVVIDNPDVRHIADILITALIANWFRPKINKTEEIKNRLDIVEKIKSGNFNKEEAEILVSGDKKLTRWCSEYFKSIHRTREVRQITASVISDDETVRKETIEHLEFEDKIITTEEKTETKTIEGTTIHIVSPILTKLDKNLSWKGIYSGKPIDFKVEDKEFLKQVYDHEIKFGNGTYITCSLIITTTTKTNDDGEIKVDYSYMVKDVSQWADDDTFQYHTKRYKRLQIKKELPKIPSLFSDEELDGTTSQ